MRNCFLHGLPRRARCTSANAAVDCVVHVQVAASIVRSSALVHPLYVRAFRCLSSRCTRHRILLASRRAGRSSLFFCFTGCQSVVHRLLWDFLVVTSICAKYHPAG
ncbi:unnamed protein product [Callosobruchus maculatus]|uniref:Uncharacterized protein n=1 Tax=Callosobruchus maculatus TaxID=64391 RepID=A0A653D8L1_CALMS|nr:unnamed protein product [Callosobruchus maculatus]